jgi:hypothetical protein
MAKREPMFSDQESRNICAISVAKLHASLLKERNSHVNADFRYHLPVAYCISLSLLLLRSFHLESRIIFLYLKRVAFLTEGDLRYLIISSMGWSDC